MNCFTGRSWVAVAGLAIVLAVAQVAEAQRGEGGRGGRGGRGFGGMGRGLSLTTMQLATAEEVQKALNLSAEEKEKVAQINEEYRDQQRELFSQGGDRRQVAEDAQKLREETAAKLATALGPEKHKRLLGILAQVDVDSALNNTIIAKDLGITEEQREALADVRRANGEAMRDAMQGMQDLSREERTAKMDAVRAEANKKLLAALSTDQQAQYEAYKGDPVKVDMAQFRTFGRGGGRDGGGRGDGGGRRNRGGGAGGAADSERGA